MKRLLIPTLLLLPCLAAATGNVADRPLDCETLKRDIATRIEANGVRSYALQVVPADAPTAGRIVGSCDGGSKRIAYRRIDLPPELLVAHDRSATPVPAR